MNLVTDSKTATALAVGVEEWDNRWRTLAPAACLPAVPATRRAPTVVGDALHKPGGVSGDDAAPRARDANPAPLRPLGDASTCADGVCHPIQARVQSLRPFWETARPFAYGRHSADFRRADCGKSSKRAERSLREMLGHLAGALEVPDQPRAIVHSSGLSFVEVRAGQRTLYAMPRELMCGREGYAALGAGASRGIVTGCCLFSASAARAVGEDGREYPITTTQATFAGRVARLIVEPWLSLYELDTILRLSTCLNALLRSSSGYRFIGVHLPCLEYVISLFDALASGQVTSAQVEAWRAAVQARGDRVMAMLTRRIGRALPEETQGRIQPLAPLAPIAAYIRDRLGAQRPPCLETALTLLGQQSPLWAAVLAATRPVSWHELTYASYSLGYLQAARAADLTIAVENPLELPIYTQTRRLAMRCFGRAPALAGLYLHEMVVATDTSAGGSLYQLPEDRGRLGDRKELVHAYAGREFDAASARVEVMSETALAPEWWTVNPSW